MLIEDFVELLLAEIASLDVSYDYKNKKKSYYAVLPFDYKDRIENIICANNDWRQKFCRLIDTLDYFNDHFKWEEQLSISLSNYLKNNNKIYQFDFENDSFLIEYTFEEIRSIRNKYNDKYFDYYIKDANWFAQLLVNDVNSRKYKEYVGIDTRIKDAIKRYDDYYNYKKYSFINEMEHDSKNKKILVKIANNTKYFK